MTARAAAQIRADLGHPIIDTDGHTVEFVPALEAYLREEGTSATRPDFRRTVTGTLGPIEDWYALTPAERARHRAARGPWGAMFSEHAIDQATAFVPRLLHDRLDELGIDVSVVYPSYGLLFPHFEDENDRRGACRALNRMNADVFGPLADRLVPVALIPMHDPAEAIDELRYAVGTLGYKAVVMPGFVQRPVAAVAEQHPELASWALWSDTFGLDSQHDYDPVWATCQELGVAPAFHSAAMGWQNRRSISSYVYNHVGMLGESNHAIAKSLFLGGVTRRFPELNFAFLEGGVAWAASLYADLLGHWEKRNGAVMRRLDAPNGDEARFRELFAQYAPEWADMVPSLRKYRRADAEMIDEFEACGIERAQDIHDLFVPRFFFGCEADDPMTGTAFNTRANPFGARLNAIFGSDVSHWDVPDMSEVVGEAVEMIEHGHLTAEDFRDFVFGNPVRLHTRGNPGFFDGTRVQDAVRAELAVPR